MAHPNAQKIMMKLSHLARSRRGTMSVRRTFVNAENAPPPIPCTVRPASNAVKFWAAPAAVEPAAKSAIPQESIVFLPKTSDRAAIQGCNTVAASRYDVPAQAASTADPFSSSDTFCRVD